VCNGTNYFCHVYQLHINNAQLPNQYPCEKFTLALQPKKRYCHPMYDNKYCSLAHTNLREMQDNPDIRHLAPVAYQQAILKTRNTLGIGKKYAQAEFYEHVDAVLHYLQLVVTLRKWTDATHFEESVLKARMNIDEYVPCVLYLHNRVIENIISMVMLRSLDGQDKIKSARLCHAERMQKWWNELAF
jgi:hypothetical protein